MDKKTEAIQKAKDVIKSHISNAGKAYKENEEKKAKPSAIGELSSNAGNWVKKKVSETKKSVAGPNKVKRFKKWVANGSMNLAKDAIGVVKTGAHEGRANVVAAKIVGKRALGKKATKSEKKFLGKQAVNNLKTTASVGIIGAANYAVGATPVPGMSEGLAWGTNKLGLTPKKQRIPKRYEKDMKMTKLNSALDKGTKSISEAKKRYNKKVDDEIREANKKRANKLKAKMKSLNQKKDTNNSAEDSKLNRDIRKENISNINNMRNTQAEIGLSMASKLGGAAVGGVIGNAINSALHKKKRARAHYITSKGLLATDKEKEELGKINKYLGTFKKASIAGGAVLGGIGGGAAYYKLRGKQIKKDKKAIWNTEVE